MRFKKFLEEATKEISFKKYCEETFNILKSLPGYDSGNRKGKPDYVNGEEQTALMKFYKIYDGDEKNNLSKWEKNIDSLSKIFGNLKKTKKDFEIVYEGKIKEGFDVYLVSKIKIEEYRSVSSLNIKITGKKLKSDNEFIDFPEIVPGTIYYSTFGYSMILVSFYEVVRRTGKTVYLKELQRKIVRDTGYEQGEYVPIKGQYASNEIIRSIIKNKDTISIGRNKSGRIWDGKPVFFDRND